MGINSRGYTKLTPHSTFFKGDAVVWEQQTLGIKTHLVIQPLTLDSIGLTQTMAD